MKKIIILLCLSCLNLSKAQEPPAAFVSCMGDPEILKRSICLATDYQTEVEDNIKWALDKYWTSSKVITAAAQTPYNKNLCYIAVGDWQTKGEGGSFISTKMQAAKPISASSANIVFEMPFDNIHHTKGEAVIGADKDVKIIACKALSYAMIFCYIAQNFNAPDMKRRKACLDYAGKLASNKERLKTTTVLVPKELLDNGITEEALKIMKSKYIIETSEQIANRIKEGKDVKNYSHFIVYKRDKFTSNAYLLDIETGELLASAMLGCGADGKTLKLEDKHVIGLLNKIYADIK